MLLSRACPGLFATTTDRCGDPISGLDYVTTEMPLAQASALIHTARILDGEVMIWPDPRLSKRGRWWLKVKQLFGRKSNQEISDVRA